MAGVRPVRSLRLFVDLSEFPSSTGVSRPKSTQNLEALVFLVVDLSIMPVESSNGPIGNLHPLAHLKK